MKTFIILPVLLFSSLLTTESIASPSAMAVSSTTESPYDVNRDGYIYHGKITLTRIISKKKETFYLFNKGGVDYVAKSMSGPYYRLSRRMIINHVEYTY